MQEGSDSAPDTVKSTTVAVTGKTSVLNLDYNVAALLCYVPFCAVNLIFSIIFLKTEPKTNQFVRFNSMQSLVLAASFLMIAIVASGASAVLGAIPLLGLVFIGINSLAIGLLSLAYIIINILAMINAYQSKPFRIKYAADFADNLLTKF